MKRKLLFAMLSIVSVLGLKAQFTDGGKYVFQNVGSGRYLAPGNSWGTQASLIETSHFNTVHLSNGKYKLESQVSNGGTSYYVGVNGDNLLFMDNGGSEFTIEEVTTGVYTISVNGTYLGYDGSTTKCSHELADASSDNAKWKIMAYDAVYADAREDNPVDLTYMILCSNFDRNHRSASAWTMNASNQNLSGGNNTNRVAESWQSAFTLSQTVTVPNGNYKLRAQAALTEYTVTGADFPVVYLNNATAPFKTMTGGEDSMDKMSASFTSGKYWTDYTDVVTVTNNTITVGVRGTRTNTWCVWDNFQLIYLGVDLTALRDALQDQINAVAALEGTTTTAAYNNAKTYADGIDVASLMTEEAIAAAATELSTRVNTATALQALYTRYQNIKTAVLALDDDATIFTGDATINTTTADTELEAATTADGINSAIATLRGVASSFIGAVTVNDGKSFNITNIFITNPAPWANTDGWICPVAATPNPSARSAEFWNKSGVSISQEMASLPVGYYTLRAQAFARTGCAPIYIFAGAADTDSSDDNIQELIKKSNSEISTMAAAGTWFDGGNGWNTFTYQNETAGSFTIGLKDEFKPNGSHGDGNDGWLIWRQFELLYLGTEPVSVLAELYKDAKDAAEAARDNATYANVVGAERAALLAAIADTPEETADSYKAKTSALIVATNSFIDDGVVLAWNNYATAFAAERTKALALGLDDETVNKFLEQFMSDDVDDVRTHFYRVEYLFAISVFGKLFKELKQRGIDIKDVSFDGENFCVSIDDILLINFVGIGVFLLLDKDSYNEEEQDEFPYMYLWSKKKREILCACCMTEMEYGDMINAFVEKIKDESL